MQSVREHCSGVEVTFDQCMYGLKHKKPTMVVTNARSHHNLVRQCDHPKGTHSNLMGRNAYGKFLSKAQAEYPQQLCATLADMFVGQRKFDLRRGHWSKGEPWEALRRRLSPSCGELWHPVSAIGAPTLPCSAMQGWESSSEV